MMTTKIEINGKKIQVDRSGAGHHWVAADQDFLPANVQAEIEGEIIDGKVEHTGDFTASNGQHYRW